MCHDLFPETGPPETLLLTNCSPADELPDETFGECSHELLANFHLSTGNARALQELTRRALAHLPGASEKLRDLLLEKARRREVKND